MLKGRRFRRRWLLLLLLIPVLAVAGFAVWAEIAAAPMPEALAALQSDNNVAVTTDGWLQFVPVQNPTDVGFVFYPGARVDPRAYAPMARALAAQGYLTIIPPMPLNLAIFGINTADAVIAAHPEIDHWAVGGHSLGGSMAARYIQSQPTKVQGLILLASYPDVDLSKLALKAVIIYGSLDGLATVATVEGTRRLLPSSTTWVKIDGGDHAQMGWYGAQAGDNDATISRDTQQKQVVEAAAALLNSLRSTKSS